MPLPQRWSWARGQVQRALAGVALGAGLGVAAACSAQQQLEGASHGIATPLGVVNSTPTPGAQPAAGRTLDLEEFRPVLVQAEFAEVARALAEEKPKEALLQYERALQRKAALRGQQNPAANDPALLFLLGRLQERAGEGSNAIASYLASAQQDWVLNEYAAYCAGRLQLSTGQPKAALTQLQRVAAQLPLPSALHLGEAHLLLGQRSEAISQLRRFLGSAEAPEGWVRASLLLARALLSPAPSPPSPVTGSTPDVVLAEQRLEDQLEALRLVRRVATETAGSSAEQEAVALERRILAALSPEEFARQQVLPLEEQVVRLNALVEARRFADGQAAVLDLQSAAGFATSPVNLRCEVKILGAKLAAGKRQWASALETLQQALSVCTDVDARARALFLAGRYALSDERLAEAARHFAQLEKEAPSHRLADDARVKGAYAYLELGDEARFTQLLGGIAEDYPSGDMTLDGVFDLAIRRIQRADWAGAASVLERAMPSASAADATREHEAAGRERYFRARAWIETGDREKGLLELADLIRQRPFSYYMQLAYSRLWVYDAARAEQALAEGMQLTQEQPFAFRWRPEFDSAGFARALQLLRLSEVEWASAEINHLGLSSEAREPDLLWGLALLYERAGSAHLSQKMLRGRVTDWLSRWPVGDWRKAWEIAFPRPHHDIVQREAKRNGITESLIYGVMREESVFDAQAVSHADAYGLMQLIAPTAKQFSKKLKLAYSERGLLRPATNIALGSRVLKDYQALFPDNPLLVIPAYNAGPGRPKRWLTQNPNLDFDVWVELIPFRETRRYTKRVLASRGAYSVLYNAEGGPAAWRLPTQLLRAGTERVAQAGK